MPRNQYDWTQFLGRTPAPVDSPAVRRAIADKTVLITGAGGFIGTALARRIALFNPRRLVLLDTSEHGLHELDAGLQSEKSSVDRELILGDMCEQAVLADIFAHHHPHIVVHAAASKHVWLNEMNPFAAARNNIIGTHRVLAAAVAAGVEKFLLVSTDKAADPLSWMGATKRMAELIVSANSSGTSAHAVRLGNVLGSTGSVVPRFEQQIAEGRPLTLSDPRCTRFFLSIDEVVQLMLAALLVENATPILACHAGTPRRIAELAQFMVQCAEAGHAGDLEFTGLRPGEKVDEMMIGSDEHVRDSGLDSLQLVVSRTAPSHDLLLSSLAQIEAAITSRDVHALISAVSAVLPRYRPGAALVEYAARMPGAPSL